MRNFTVTVPAGGSKRFNAAGSRILLCDASSLPSFIVKVDDGEDIPFKEGRKYTHPGGTYSLIDVINPDTVNALTVSFLVGSGDMSDNSVYVNSIQQIVQTVNVEDAPLLAETALVKAAVQAIGTLLQSGEEKYIGLGKLGVQGGTAGSGSHTFITPAANLNGLILRTAVLYTTNQLAALWVDTAAPASATNLNTRCVLRNYSGNIVLPHPLYVPAGHGIFYTLTGTWNTNYGASITYDLL